MKYEEQWETRKRKREREPGKGIIGRVVESPTDREHIEEKRKEERLHYSRMSENKRLEKIDNRWKTVVPKWRRDGKMQK